ncbi:MAG: class I SAM-dependent methyltransferase [Lachnospiraceae bacterium]|nr:class I SAM-dependent methyltransferase [Lachnospiraceae bacterium]
MAFNNGLSKIPAKVAEFGPGNTIGSGLSAMLCGADELYCLDIFNYANTHQNQLLFDELVKMFMKKMDIPDDVEFPAIKPKLQDYSFPSNILTKEKLVKSLDKERINRIRECIGSLSEKKYKEKVLYIAPWDSKDAHLTDVDFIFSQAVLEHIDNLEDAYAFFSKAISDNGYMGHQIDFKCHGTATKWNGHWSYSKLLFKLYRGKKPYLINRQPFSVHELAAEKYGFNLVNVTKQYSDEEGIKRRQLKKPFKHITDEDLITSGAYVLFNTLRDKH